MRNRKDRENSKACYCRHRAAYELNLGYRYQPSDTKDLAPASVSAEKEKKNSDSLVANTPSVQLSLAYSFSLTNGAAKTCPKDTARARVIRTLKAMLRLMKITPSRGFPGCCRVRKGRMEELRAQRMSEKKEGGKEVEGERELRREREREKERAITILRFIRFSRAKRTIDTSAQW